MMKSGKIKGGMREKMMKGASNMMMSEREMNLNMKGMQKEMDKMMVSHNGNGKIKKS